MAAVDAPADARIADPRVDASRAPRCRCRTGARRSAAAAARTRRSPRSATWRRRARASSACAQGLSTLAGRPVIVYGMARAFGALPNTASISGAAASRSGITTRMSDGRGGCRSGEERQQLVLQHLELARHRVADVDFDAAVVVGERDAAAREIRQVEDRVLDLREERCRRRSARSRRRRPRRAVVLRAGGRCAPASACPTRTAGDCRLRDGRRGPARRGTREPLRVDDLEPVLAARVEHVEPQVDPLRQSVQDVEVERRRGRQAEEVRGGRQPGAGRGVRPHLLHRVEEGDRRMAAVGAEVARRCAATARPASARRPRAPRRGPRSSAGLPASHAASQSGR